MLATWIGWAVAKGDPLPIWNYEIIMIILSIGCFVGASNILNDIKDNLTDRVSHPLRPLSEGRLSGGITILYMSSLFVISFSLSFVASIMISSTIPILIFLIAILLQLSYEAYLKNKGFFGNLVVSVNVGLSFLYGASVHSLKYILLPIFIMSCLANLSREIVKDVQDMKGDRIFRNTLPNRIGEKCSLSISSLLIVIAIITSVYPMIFTNASFYYIVPVIAADIFFIYSIIIAFNNASKSQFTIKIGMVFAIFSFIGLAI